MRPELVNVDGGDAESGKRERERERRAGGGHCVCGDGGDGTLVLGSGGGHLVEVRPLIAELLLPCERVGGEQVHWRGTERNQETWRNVERRGREAR